MKWHFGCQRSLIHSWWLRWRGNSVTLTLRKLRKPVQRMECTCHGSRKPKLKRRHGLVSSGIGVPFPPWMGVLSATTTPMPPISTTHLEDSASAWSLLLHSFSRDKRCRHNVNTDMLFTGGKSVTLCWWQCQFHQLTGIPRRKREKRGGDNSSPERQRRAQIHGFCDYTWSIKH